MARKVILIILDGLAYQTGADCMGFLQGLCQAGQGKLYKMNCELPSLSRPLYECILTGVPPVQSGIFHNQITRNSSQESIFSLARAQDKITAAAAYNWISELYNETPWDPYRDRFTQDPDKLIQYGLFYAEDHYPDSHLFFDAEFLRRQYNPDFLLVHPMNIDDAGHKGGIDSAIYRNTARQTDSSLSDILPFWLSQGYQILITADHGMNVDHSHGGTLPEEMAVPLWVFGASFSKQAALPQQTDLCGICCDLLGVPHQKPSCQDLFVP